MNNPFQTSNNSQNGLNDPLSFVKKLWGDMQLPGMVTPTLSMDELDKQIKDLKTVESWLQVNMNMLHGTIQALEVQRATIAALKTMGESFAHNTVTSSATTSAESPDTENKINQQKASESENLASASTSFTSPEAWWTVLQDQFKQALGGISDTKQAVKKSTSSQAKAKPSMAKSTVSTVPRATKPRKTASKT